MPHKISNDIYSDHNAAIREEIGHRLRMLLSQEADEMPTPIQQLLDKLSRQDALKILKRDQKPN